jgi:single-stranded DNA-binding protein
MTAHVLVTGTLYRPPEQRVSKTGRNFVVATLRADYRDRETQWWKVACFSETAQAELMRLSEGDAVSCQGALQVETYDKDGETKLSLSIRADQVLALKQPPRQRERKANEQKPDTRAERPGLASHGCAGADEFRDAVPF